MLTLLEWKLPFKLFVFLVPVFTSLNIGLSQEQPGQPSVKTHQDVTQIFRQYRPVVGQPHPDFVLPSIADGKTIQLSDYRGTKVLLLHFASW